MGLTLRQLWGYIRTPLTPSRGEYFLFGFPPATGERLGVYLSGLFWIKDPQGCQSLDRLRLVITLEEPCGPRYSTAKQAEMTCQHQKCRGHHQPLVPSGRRSSALHQIGRHYVRTAVSLIAVFIVSFANGIKLSPPVAKPICDSLTPLLISSAFTN